MSKNRTRGCLGSFSERELNRDSAYKAPSDFKEDPRENDPYKNSSDSG